MKFPWVREEKQYVRVNDSGVAETVTVKGMSGPDFQTVMEENVVYPKGRADVQSVPWISFISQLYPYEIMDREENGIYDAGSYEEIAGHMGSRNEAIPKIDKRQYRPDEDLDNMYDIHEIYAIYDPDDSGVMRRSVSDS